MKFEFDYQCDKGWDEMKGGARRRFCDSCEKHVHHISHMSKEEALKFLDERNYEVCVDFYRDSDGDTVFRERERKLAMQAEGLKQLLASAVAIVPLALAAAFVDLESTPQTVPIVASSDPSPPPLNLEEATPVVVNPAPNAFFDRPPVPPVIEPIVMPVSDEPAPVVEELPEPEPEVIAPIRHVRGRIKRPHPSVLAK